MTKKTARHGTPVRAGTGNRPSGYDPVTPMDTGPAVTQGPQPSQVEPPSDGLLPDQKIGQQPGRPRSVIPAKPGTPVTERVRPPKTENTGS